MTEKLQTADEQREYIVRMMLEREWRPGRSHKQLAKDWGIAPRTVAQRALEASRAIHVANGGLQEFICRKMSELDTVIEQAMDCVKLDKEGGTIESPDLKAAIAAIRVQGELMGAIGARSSKERPKLDDDVKSKYKQMSPAERIAEHEKAIAEERAKLESSH